VGLLHGATLFLRVRGLVLAVGIVTHILLCQQKQAKSLFCGSASGSMFVVNQCLHHTRQSDPLKLSLGALPPPAPYTSLVVFLH